MSFISHEDRIESLEAMFGQFIKEAAIINSRAEAREKAAEQRMQRLEHEMTEFKDEMSEFKNEMSEFKDDMRRAKLDTDKKWGDLVNKMGTIVEDILAPNLKRIAIEHFGMEILSFSVRVNRKIAGHKKWGEFDTIIASADRVIVGDAKSSASIAYADAFAQKLTTFFDYCAEHQGKQLVGIMGSWSIPDVVTERLTELGIYAMQMGPDTMELVNAAALEKGAATKTV